MSESTIDGVKGFVAGAMAALESCDLTRDELQRALNTLNDRALMEEGLKALSDEMNIMIMAKDS